MIGRGMRMAPGKDCLTVFDHAGLVYEHGLPDGFAWDWSLDGGARKRRIAAARQSGEVIRRCPKCSCAHAIAATCPECGFAYPTGREVSEYDGSLVAIAGDEVTVPEFARRLGVTTSAIRIWFGKGMPRRGGLVPLSEALRWHADNVAPEGWLTIDDFARAAKVSKTFISRCIRAGMPHQVTAASGRFYLQMEAAQGWARDNINVPVRPFWEDDPSDFISRQKVARQIGVSIGLINRMIDEGLPASTNNFVRASSLSAWVERNHPDLVAINNGGFVSFNEFARRMGVSANTVRRAASSGLPVAGRATVDFSAAAAWWKESEFHHTKMRPQPGYEAGAAFARRLLINRGVVQRMKPKGLPSDNLGSVHIRKGLEWVRDNTSIVIPPEAWPDDGRGEVDNG